MLSAIFLNSRNETHLARFSIFVHLVTDLSIYSISFILFYFILFYFTLFIIFYRRSEFFNYLFFFIYFVIICPVPGCSGMFRNVPGCSGMFHVPGFVNAPLERQTNVIYTEDEKVVDRDLRSAYFSDLDEIGEAYELESRKPRITIRRPFQVGIAVYQLAKLRMLEFYYGFLDRYFDRKDFELIQMDTDSNYMKNVRQKRKIG